MRQSLRVTLLSCVILVPLILLGFKVGYPVVKQQIQERALTRVTLKPPATPIPKTLFSMHALNLQYDAAWPSIPFGSWRSWDAAGTWAYLEPQKGTWNFQLLDQYVSLAQKSKAEVVLVLGLTPRWASTRPYEDSAYKKGTAAEPKQIEDWKNYVRQVATRYQGRVRYYEVWNEPNSKRFYSGTVKQLVELSRVTYQTVKAIDPAAQVISPGMSPCCQSLTYLDAYLRAGGGNYADVIGYHFYVAPDQPELMLPQIHQVKALMAKHGVGNKPLWNTETGWRIQNRDINPEAEPWLGKPLSIDEGSAYVARAYILSWAAGVERLYWYAWGHRTMGFTDHDGKTPKPVAGAFTEVQRWLVGAVLTACRSDEKSTWICELKRESNKSAYIIWNPKRSIAFTIPHRWKVQQVRTVYGQRVLLSSAAIQVHPSPLLLEG